MGHKASRRDFELRVGWMGFAAGTTTPSVIGHAAVLRIDTAALFDSGRQLAPLFRGEGGSAQLRTTGHLTLRALELLTGSSWATKSRRLMSK